MNRMKIILLAVLCLLTPCQAGVCRGGAACKACRNCTQCAWCNSGKGSCNVKREAAARAYDAKEKARGIISAPSR